MCSCPFSDIRGYDAKKQIKLQEKMKKNKPHKKADRLEDAANDRHMGIEDYDRLSVCICGSVVFWTKSQHGGRFYETNPEKW